MTVPLTQIPSRKEKKGEFYCARVFLEENLSVLVYQAISNEVVQSEECIPKIPVKGILLSNLQQGSCIVHFN